jgi:hypothetical protein
MRWGGLNQEATVTTIELERTRVVPKLPAITTKGRDGIPSDLIGSEVIAFGTLPNANAIEGGGLVIDYRPAGEQETRRVVFGFTELGMWLEFRGKLR